MSEKELPPGYKVFQAKEMPRFGEFESEFPANVDLWAFQPEDFEGRWYSPLFLTREEAITEAWRDSHSNNWQEERERDAWAEINEL